MACALLGLLTPGFSQDIIIESRSEGKNYSWYSETSGSWSDSVAKSLLDDISPESIGSRFVIIDGGPVPAQAKFTPVLPMEGKYDIFVTWGRSGNAMNVKYIINTGSAEEVKYLDQAGWGGSLVGNAFIWHHLGTYDLPAGNNAYVIVDASEVTGKPSPENSGRVYSDAVKFSPYDPSAPRPAESASSSVQTASAPASSGSTSYDQSSSPFGSAPSTSSPVPYTSSASPSLPFVPLGGTASQPGTTSQPFSQPATQPASSPFGQPDTSSARTFSSPFGQQASTSAQMTPSPFSQPGVTYSQATPSPFSQPGTPFSRETPSPFSQPGASLSQTTSSPFGQPGTTVAQATPAASTVSSYPFSNLTASTQPGSSVPQATGSLPPIQSTGSIQWYASYNEAIQAGGATNKSIMLFFRSALGKSSNIMENEVLNNPQVKTILMQDFVCCKLDITQNRPICDYYSIFKAPVLVFLDSRGYSRARIDSLLDPEELARELQKYK